jgi:hypothetical protein
MIDVKDINWRHINDFPYDMPKGELLLIYTSVKVIRQSRSQYINIHTDYCEACKEKVLYWAFANLPA